MTENLHNANVALEFLKGKGIDTDKGRVFLASDVEAAQSLVTERMVERAVAPKPKTMAQAKRMIRQDEDLMAEFDYNRTEEPGGAINAGPESLSRA